MILNLFFWVIMLWFSICFGLFVKRVWILVSGKPLNEDWFTLDMIVISGVCFLTVFVQFFSLFYKVGLVANVVLMIASIMVVPLIKDELQNTILGVKQWKRVWWIVILVILGMMLLIGSLPATHMDTPLYHAQGIRWIEEYGVVKGLGLINGALAFNSSFLVLQALFGYRYVAGVELHSCNAFLMFIFHIWAIRSLNIWKNGRITRSDIFRILMLFYIYTCTKEMSSPSTDIFAIGMIIYILAKWMELIEKRYYSSAPYTYLSFFALYAATLKLSAAPFCLIALYPFFLLIKEKDYSFMRKAILAGVIIVLPFLIRNIILSGWLLYPVPAVDLFEVEWKISKEQTILDKVIIETWGKSLTDVGLVDIGIKEWFPLWFQWIGSLWRRVICISALTQVIMLVRCIYLIWDRHCVTYKRAILFIYIVETVILVIWFTTAPSIRFGGVFCMFAGATLLGEFLEIQKGNKYIYLAMIIAVILLIEYNIFDDYQGRGKPFIKPEPYTEYPVYTIQKDGVTFYCPVEDSRTGYECFPSVRGNQVEVELRKPGSLKEGFRREK